jgi:enamine deaminase RidA (YjgF/YER057c/UK114 family)
MYDPEKKIVELGLNLPKPVQLPKNLELPFNFINVRENRVLISGHPRQANDGSINGPYGQVGKDLTTQEAQLAAKEIGLSIFANLKQKIGNLSRIKSWVRVFGMVNSATGYDEQHIVLNGFSDLLLEVFGSEVGAHSRSAVGVAGLPMNLAIEIEGEVIID